MIYYSGRKGWHFPRDFGSPVAEDAEAIRELETLRREGVRYLGSSGTPCGGSTSTLILAGL